MQTLDMQRILQFFKCEFHGRNISLAHNCPHPSRIVKLNIVVKT